MKWSEGIIQYMPKKDFSIFAHERKGFVNDDLKDFEAKKEKTKMKKPKDKEQKSGSN